MDLAGLLPPESLAPFAAELAGREKRRERRALQAAATADQEAAQEAAMAAAGAAPSVAELLVRFGTHAFQSFAASKHFRQTWQCDHKDSTIPSGPPSYKCSTKYMHHLLIFIQTLAASGSAPRYLSSMAQSSLANHRLAGLILRWSDISA